jgi:hypothetical protein
MTAASLLVQLGLSAALAWLAWQLWRDDDQLALRKPSGNSAPPAAADAHLRPARRFRWRRSFARPFQRVGSRREDSSSIQRPL